MNMNRAEALTCLQRSIKTNSWFRRIGGNGYLSVYEIVTDLHWTGYYLTHNSRGALVLRSISYGYHQVSGNKYIQTWLAWKTYFGFKPTIFILNFA